ncbi:MAG: AsmA family protein [Pseudomonadota bacterium]
MILKRILFLVAALISVVVALAYFAPLFVPAEAYKERIEVAATNALGREVTIGDELSFRLLPQTTFNVTELEIANAEGFAGDKLGSVGKADIGVAIGPLLTGIVEINRFVLTEPDFNLIRAADGRTNWNLAGAPANDGAQGGIDQNAPGADLRDLRLGDVRILNGRFRYEDQSAKRVFLAEDANLRVVLKRLSEPLEIDGAMIFQGEPTDVDIVLNDLGALMDGAQANLKLDATVGDTEAGADLNVSINEALQYAGPIRFDAPDLPAFARLVGTELADAPGFDKLSLSGDVDGGATAFRLSDAKIGFDEINAQGAMTLDWAGARPLATGVLSAEELDLRPYMPPPAEAPAQGFPAWSTAKLDFTSLRNIDAQFDVTTSAIYLNDLEFGDSRLQLRVDRGRMTAEIPELAMYGGLGSGQLVVNARSATPSFSGNFEVNRINAQPLALDLMKHDNLLGLGAFNVNFTANGASQAAIMSSLDGSGGFDLEDGLIKGVNIAKMVRAVSELAQGVNPTAIQNAITAARGQQETTDFSSFLSDFSITDGVVNAPKISLSGPFLEMGGNGAVNLSAQSIDLRLSPKVSTSLDAGQGRAYSIPVRIGGTFSAPTIGVDAEALLRSGAQSTLIDLLRGGVKDDEEGEESTESDAQDDRAQEPGLRLLEELFSTPRGDGETSAPAEE